MIAALGVVWAGTMTWVYSGWLGGDLTAEYAAGVLWSRGQLDAMLGADFGHTDVAAVQAVSDEAGMPHMALPFVHMPLFAALSSPLQWLGWAPTVHLARFLLAGCIYGIWWLSAWRWAPRLLRPVPWLVAIAVLWWNHPIQFAVGYAQLHPLVVLGLLGATLLAERRRDVSAGVVLGVVASLKVTPLALLVPWLLLRRMRAVVAALVAMGVTMGVSLLLAPVELHLAWMRKVQYIGRHTLPGPVNQSLSGVAARAVHGAAESWSPAEPLQLLQFVPIPTLGTVWSVATGMVGLALLWVRSREPGDTQWGAMLSIIVALTLLVPSVSWSHYAIALLIPIAVLAGTSERHSAGIALAFLLAVAPTTPFMWTNMKYAAPYPTFYATLAVLPLLVLLAFALRIDRYTGSSVVAIDK